MTYRVHAVATIAGICLAVPWPALAMFSDVPSVHPNAQAIAYVQERGIVSGYADGTFRPDQTINRAELLKILVLSVRPPTPDFRCTFTRHFPDVDENSWYGTYLCSVLWDPDAWVEGYPDGTFRPAAPVNFVETAKILDKALDFTGAEGAVWYEAYVRALADRQAIPLSITRLDQYITRGELAEMIYRLRAVVTDKPSRTYESFLQTRDDVFVLPQYGFRIDKITSQRCTWTDSGPNAAQLRKDKGEQISGTIPPTRHEISVHCPKDIGPDFTVYVYEDYPLSIKDDNSSIDGSCGTQFASENIMNRMITPDGPGISYREVIQNVDNEQQADYCFDARNNTRVTLRWRMTDYVPYFDQMEYIADSVSIGE